jgi:predicted glycoside hydrolase/deacetylase ChbG (UPF0249 family)
MKRLLIVNADDLGLAHGVSQGILELARSGAVTSASLLMNMPGSLEALTTGRSGGLDVGLHLNISVGAPLSPPASVRGLLDARGRFCGPPEIARRLLRRRLRVDEIETEWSRQIEAALAAGVHPSHLDSHAHVHAWPGLYPLTLRLACRYGIPGVRRGFSGYLVPLWRRSGRKARRERRPATGQPVYQPHHLTVLSGLGRACTQQALASLLRSLPPGVTELICHPGYVDDELRRIDPLTDAREREQAVLASSVFQDLLVRNGVQLVSWAEAATRLRNTS